MGGRLIDSISPSNIRSRLICGAVAVFIAPFAFDTAVADVCNETQALAKLSAGEIRPAHQILVECDRRGSLSANGLYALAKTYGSRDVDDAPGSASLLKAWESLHRSAAAGNFKALSHLIYLYTHGEPEVHVSPDPAKAACLSGIRGKRALEEKFVACFQDQ